MKYAFMESQRTQLKQRSFDLYLKTLNCVSYLLFTLINNTFYFSNSANFQQTLPEKENHLFLQ